MSELNTELSFEQALERLESICKGLDNGDIPLDKSLELFEEGVGLVRQCSSMLDSVERKIKIVSEAGEVDFKNE